MVSVEAKLTLSLVALLVLPSVLTLLHPMASLALPAVFAALLVRLPGSRGRAEAWAIRGLVVWVVLTAGVRLVGWVELEVLARLFGVFVMVSLVWALFGRVVAPGKVDEGRLFTSASTYLAAGFAFGTAYQLVEMVAPGSFTGLPDDPVERSRALTYFSFMTLTTVGYGDISPVTSQVRALAALQAAVGQLYMAILVGRLIGLHMGGEEQPGDGG